MSERKAHLAWCKQRALEFLPGDPVGAVSSFRSDILKEESTKDVAELASGAMAMLGTMASTSAHEARRYIEGFS